MHCRERRLAQLAPRRCLGCSSEPPAQDGADVTSLWPHPGAISLARVMTLAWQLPAEEQLDMYQQLGASLKQNGHIS